jgi:hypothetical protein
MKFSFYLSPVFSRTVASCSFLVKDAKPRPRTQVAELSKDAALLR